jgi:hypothetical protein
VPSRLGHGAGGRREGAGALSGSAGRSSSPTAGPRISLRLVGGSPVGDGRASLIERGLRAVLEVFSIHEDPQPRDGLTLVDARTGRVLWGLAGASQDERTSERFRLAFGRLPARVQKRARAAYRLFRQDPSHPSLRFKQVHPSRPIYSVRIGLAYRALGVRDWDEVRGAHVG